MNKKELAKLVYKHPMVKNLYKSSDKTVINKLIAEEVLREAGYKNKQKIIDIVKKQLKEKLTEVEEEGSNRELVKDILDLQQELRSYGLSEVEIEAIKAESSENSQQASTETPKQEEPKNSTTNKTDQEQPKETSFEINIEPSDAELTEKDIYQKYIGKLLIADELKNSWMKFINFAFNKIISSKELSADQEFKNLPPQIVGIAIEYAKENGSSPYSIKNMVSGAYEKIIKPFLAYKLYNYKKEGIISDEDHLIKIEPEGKAQEEISAEEARVKYEALEEADRIRIKDFIEWAIKKLKNNNIKEQIYRQIIQILNEADVPTEKEIKKLSKDQLEVLFEEYISLRQYIGTRHTFLQKHFAMVLALLNEQIQKEISTETPKQEEPQTNVDADKVPQESPSTAPSTINQEVTNMTNSSENNTAQNDTNNKTSKPVAKQAKTPSKTEKTGAVEVATPTQDSVANATATPTAKKASTPKKPKNTTKPSSVENNNSEQVVSNSNTDKTSTNNKTDRPETSTQQTQTSQTNDTTQKTDQAGQSQTSGAEVEAEKQKFQKMYELARTTTDIGELRKLAKDESFYKDWQMQIKFQVAQNPHTPEDVLSLLADHEHINVKEAVVENQNTPKDVLIKFAKAYKEKDNPGYVIESFKKLFGEESQYIYPFIEWYNDKKNNKENNAENIEEQIYRKVLSILKETGQDDIVKEPGEDAETTSTESDKETEASNKPVSVDDVKTIYTEYLNTIKDPEKKKKAAEVLQKHSKTINAILGIGEQPTGAEQQASETGAPEQTPDAVATDSTNKQPEDVVGAEQSDEEKPEVSASSAQTAEQTGEQTDAALENDSQQQPAPKQKFIEVYKTTLDGFFGFGSPSDAFMKQVLLRKQAEKLLLLISTLNTLLENEQLAYTDDAAVQKNAKPEEQQSVQTEGILDRFRKKSSNDPKGSSIDVEEDDDQLVKVSPQTKVALREELISLVDSLKHLKTIVDRYQQYSQKKSMFAQFDGSSLKNVMNKFIKDLQVVLAKIYKDLEKIKPTEQSLQSEAKRFKRKINEDSRKEFGEKVKIVNDVYNRMLQKYKDALRPTLVGELDKGTLEKALLSAEEIKNLATEEKFISLFPQVNYIKGNVVSIDDAMKNVQELIEEFIKTARDIALLTKRGEGITYSQINDSRYKIAAISQSLQDNFGVKSLINQESIQKFEAEQAKNTNNKSLTTTPSTSTINGDSNQQSSDLNTSNDGTTSSPGAATTTDNTEAPSSDMSNLELPKFEEKDFNDNRVEKGLDYDKEKDRIKADTNFLSYAKFIDYAVKELRQQRQNNNIPNDESSESDTVEEQIYRKVLSILKESENIIEQEKISLETIQQLLEKYKKEYKKTKELSSLHIPNLYIIIKHLLINKISESFENILTKEKQKEQEEQNNNDEEMSKRNILESFIINVKAVEKINLKELLKDYKPKENASDKEIIKEIANKIIEKAKNTVTEEGLFKSLKNKINRKFTGIKDFVEYFDASNLKALTNDFGTDFHNILFSIEEDLGIDENDMILPEISEVIFQEIVSAVKKACEYAFKNNFINSATKNDAKQILQSVLDEYIIQIKSKFPDTIFKNQENDETPDNEDNDETPWISQGMVEEKLKPIIEKMLRQYYR